MPGIACAPCAPPCAIPISLIVSNCGGSSAGTSALIPGRGANVPRAYPDRSIDCAKIVYARSSLGSTITSSTSAVPMRSSSTVTGSTSCPSAATTVSFKPGMRTSKKLIDEPQPHALAALEERRPVAARRRAVHEIRVRRAVHVGQVGGAHAHLPPHAPIGDRLFQALRARVSNEITDGALVVVVVVALPL